MEMGIEMYQRIVEEAVAELKEQEFDKMFQGAKALAQRPAGETTIDADVEAYIPDIFIESDSERLDFYRRLYGVANTEDIESMRHELRDRFGEYPEEVENLFGVVELKTIASGAGFVKVELQRNQLSLFFPSSEETLFYEPEDGSISRFQRIMSHIATMRQYRAQLKQDGKQLRLLAIIPGGSEPRSVLTAAKALLLSLAAVSTTTTA
ncbi:MAG TPA: TRCF domain-containing protein, partial [Bacteroidota bacterium]|nr:TRCF domain-containing protein [Bacteroidota bacterium]